MVDNSFNTENKFFLRDKWNKPLIKFLSKNVKDKLVYMGLPSPNGDDVNHWIEFIKVVIAFQCREYSKPSDSTQSREDVEKLEEFLRALERESKLESYVVYDGYLEEVVLKGRDNSPQSIHFEIQRFITLYNLDFCNDIASPIEFVDELGDLQTVFKFDAIKKLDNRFLVGGPAVCGGTDEVWIRSFMEYCETNDLAVDFVTRHHYTSEPPKTQGHYSYIELMDPEDGFANLHTTREIIDSFPRFKGLPIHITEFNTSYVPNCPIHDTTQNAAYIAHQLSRLGDDNESYSYWTFGDVFEANHDSPNAGDEFFSAK